MAQSTFFNSLIKVCLRWGAIAGLIGSILSIAMFYMGRHPLLIAPYLDYRLLLFAIFIFFALREYRDVYQAGALYFWQGLIGSLVVTMTASMIGAFGIFVFGELEPRFIAEYVTSLTEYLKGFPESDIARIGKETFDRNLAQLPTTNSKELAQTYFGQGMVIGFFVSIILSVILRRQP